VAYTLVSIGKLDNAGFTATFGGQKCTIKRHGGNIEEVVGVVQKTLLGVYKVEHEDGVANAAEERLTLEKFHHHMGHMSPEVARKLVKDNMFGSNTRCWAIHFSVLHVSMPSQRENWSLS